MGSLNASLINASNALKVYQGALNATQNNVTNANSPGYAKQRPSLVALPFDTATGAPGGVRLGAMQSSRNQFAEQAVRTSQFAYSFDQQKTGDLSNIQNYFSMTATSGIAPAMSALFQSFSQLSVTPNDTVARQTVLNNATTVAQQFNNTADGLLNQINNLNAATRGTVQSINQLAETIANLNASNPQDLLGGVDAGVDAQLNSALDQLSQYANFSILKQPDGTLTVYLGGQTPLVVGSQAYEIQGDFSTPPMAILSSSGHDITGQITGGQLGAEIEDYNTVIPSYIASLNTLAQTFADQVNNTLNNGIDQNGAAPVTNLFSYDPYGGAALTLTVNPLTPDQIAAATPGAPGGNGNALALADLANARPVDGYTFAEAYGNLGGQVGNDLSLAQSSSTANQNLLTQAESVRQQTSGVSLDEEALNLMLYERSYDAISKMLGVLNSLSLNVINLLPPMSSS